MEALIQSGLTSGLFYGAEVLLAKGTKIKLHRAYGTFDGTRPLTENATFDIASLSKPVATASLLLALDLPLEQKVSAYLPRFTGPMKGDITLRQLASHSAGLPATVRFSDFCKTRKQARTALYNVPLAHPPGQRVTYSCLGYLLLGEVLAKASGQPLTTLFNHHIAKPVGMSDSGYTPLENGVDPARLVPNRPAPAQAGIVHDSNALIFGGAAGNAGLFSTAQDLFRFAHMLLTNGEGVFPARAASVMFRNFSLAGQTPRSLGWEVKQPATPAPSCGVGFPDGAIGHTGFTGTALWMDKKSGLIAILLTNRTAISHSGTLGEMKIFRQLFFELAAETI